MKLTILLLLSAALSACATTRWVPVTTVTEALGTLRPGDTVHVVMKSDRAFTATVRKVTRAVLTTRGGEYAWADIRSLRVERVEYPYNDALVRALGAAATTVPLSLEGAGPIGPFK